MSTLAYIRIVYAVERVVRVYGEFESLTRVLTKIDE
jgi:hypothetical protein